MDKDTATFKEWMIELSRQFSSKYSFHIMDLPDMCFRDWYEDYMTVEDVMEDEFGSLSDIQRLVFG